MRRVKEIRAAIRELRHDMKAAGIPVRCFLNRMDVQAARCNERLFALKLELEKAQAANA